MGPTSEPHDSGPDEAVSIGGPARRYLFVFLCITPIYLIWRTTTVGAGWMLALSMPWLWSEVWSIAQIFALRHDVTGVGGYGSKRGHISEPAGAPIRASQDLEIAVLVPSSATNADIERTVVGLQAAAQPGRITLLASAQRGQELTELSRHWGALAFQMVRLADGVPDRSADRLDVILANTELPWVLWLEAGQVPMPELVDELDTQAIDDRVAAYQISLGLLNAQSLVHVNRLGDEEALERRLIGPALAERGLAPWHGPGSVVRRAAFTGRPPLHDPTVSELSRYSVEMKRDGLRFDYDPRPLIRVPAADSLHPYLVARRHRSLAALEELGLSWTLPGVGWSVRRAALARAVSITHGLRQLGILSILVACLIAGRLPVVADDTSVLVVMSGFAAASMLARRALSGGTMAFGDWVKHSWRTLGADIAALTPRFARPLHLVHPRLRIAHRGSLGRMQFLTLSFVVLEVALTTRALNTIHPLLLPAMSRQDLAVLLAVSIGVTVALLAVLGGLARHHGRRRSPRVAFETDITVAGSSGSTLDITPSGLGALVGSAPPVGATSPLHFTITGHNGAARRVEATGTVRTATLHESGSVRVGIEFDELDVEDRMAITEYCALGLSETSTVSEASTDHLAAEASFGQLVMVRGLGALSVVAAVGAMMLGPQAGAVSANSETRIPSLFTTTVGGVSGAEFSADMTVRLHTDAWSEPLAVNDEGGFERGSSPESWMGPVHLEVVLGDERHVDLVPADGTIRLAAVEVADTVSVSIVGSGGHWRSVADGHPLLPGPYTLRWSTDDQAPRTAAVLVGAAQIVSIRTDGVEVGAAPLTVHDGTEPVDEIPSTTGSTPASAGSEPGEDSQPTEPIPTTTTVETTVADRSGTSSDTTDTTDPNTSVADPTGGEG